MAALRLRDAGFEVTLFERRGSILCGASYNNQNRLHLGYHYPRSPETIAQCARGFQRFASEFPECLSRGWPNAYFIMAEGSLTSPESYARICEANGLPFDPIRAEAFPIRLADVANHGTLTEEAVYDSRQLAGILSERLARSSIQTRTDTTIERIERSGSHFLLDREPFAAVVNCTFGDINRLTDQLGHTVEAKRYEYTAQLVLEADLPRVGATVMDSPTRGVTLLPLGHSTRWLLYHAGLAVRASVQGQQLDRSWLDPDTSPFAREDRDSWTRRMLAECSRFLPDLAGARPVGFLQGPRMVPADSDARDQRPSFVQQREPGYITVHAGKIDHCIETADDVVRLVTKGRV